MFRRRASKNNEGSKPQKTGNPHFNTGDAEQITDHIAGVIETSGFDQHRNNLNFIAAINKCIVDDDHQLEMDKVISFPTPIEIRLKNGYSVRVSMNREREFNPAFGLSRYFPKVILRNTGDDITPGQLDYLHENLSDVTFNLGATNDPNFKGGIHLAEPFLVG